MLLYSEQKMHACDDVARLLYMYDNGHMKCADKHDISKIAVAIV